MLPVLTTKTEDPDGLDSTVELVECSPEQKIERVESFPTVSYRKVFHPCSKTLKIVILMTILSIRKSKQLKSKMTLGMKTSRFTPLPRCKGLVQVRNIVAVDYFKQV